MKMTEVPRLLSDRHDPGTFHLQHVGGHGLESQCVFMIGQERYDWFQWTGWLRSFFEDQTAGIQVYQICMTYFHPHGSLLVMLAFFDSRR